MPNRTYYGWTITGTRGEWYASLWTPGRTLTLTVCPCRTLVDTYQAIRDYQGR